MHQFIGRTDCLLCDSGFGKQAQKERSIGKIVSQDYPIELRRVRQIRRQFFDGWTHWLPIVVMLIVVGGLSACTMPAPAQQPSTSDTPTPANTRLTDISDYALPTAQPVIVPDVSALVTTEGARANVRSGPALDSPIVAKANPGDAYKVTGKSADGEWWQICCVQGPSDKAGKPTETAWVAKVVIKVDGNADVVPVINPLLPSDVQASWQVDWKCPSSGCKVKECAATISATTNSAKNAQQWLDVSFSTKWDNDCAQGEPWSFQVDRYSGKERSGQYKDIFFSNYWAGEQPGPATNVYTLDNGKKVAVWCSGPYKMDLPLAQDHSWTELYQGTTCHDVRTGLLVAQSYTIRYLYTGEYNGQKYDHAYFGNYETYDQHIVDTNVDLDYINK